MSVAFEWAAWVQISIPSWFISEFQSTNGGSNNTKAPAQRVLEALNEVCVTFSSTVPWIYHHHWYDWLTCNVQVMQLGRRKSWALLYTSESHASRPHSRAFCPQLPARHSYLPGLPCSSLRPWPQREETAQQTLMCWPRSETWKFTKTISKCWFGREGAEAAQRKETFQKPLEELPFTAGSSFPLFVFLTSSWPPHFLWSIWPQYGADFHKSISLSPADLEEMTHSVASRSPERPRQTGKRRVVVSEDWGC